MRQSARWPLTLPLMICCPYGSCQGHARVLKAGMSPRILVNNCRRKLEPSSRPEVATDAVRSPLEKPAASSKSEALPQSRISKTSPHFSWAAQITAGESCQKTLAKRPSMASFGPREFGEGLAEGAPRKASAAAATVAPAETVSGQEKHDQRFSPKMCSW